MVERVSDKNETATEDNLEAMGAQASENYLRELEQEWQQEAPLVI